MYRLDNAQQGEKYNTIFSRTTPAQRRKPQCAQPLSLAVSVGAVPVPDDPANLLADQYVAADQQRDSGFHDVMAQKPDV
ncbi:hypothetical protein [Halomonas lionensis]|uniref:hypothetical protein n=1 Tax=Vreelandella lionensis TaxID=1144478 RepID=UPI00178CB7E9